MVSRAQTRRGMIPRDELVTRGEESRERHNQPWMYSAKVKSGRRRTQTVVKEAYNKEDLLGQVIVDFGNPDEDLFVYNVVKIMKYQSRVRDY